MVDSDPNLIAVQLKKLSTRSGWLATAGIVVSLYATYHHVFLRYANVADSFCNITDLVTCDRIAQSPYSEWWQVPLGLWGVAYFTCNLYHGRPWRRHFANPAAWSFVYLGFVAMGVLTSVALGMISTFAIGAYCPTCVFVYLICLS